MSNPHDYTVGWICAIDKEYIAATAFLDETHDGPEYVSTHDNNTYKLGRVGRHNVVIAVAPDGEYGTQSAATVARDMMHSFPNVRIGLMVGIAGGVPSSKNDIRLGDIVVSAPRDGRGGVFQYDFGKEKQGQGFQATGFLNQPPPLLRTAVAALRAEHVSDGHNLNETVQEALGRKPRLRKKCYGRPDQETDRLYRSDIVHPSDDDRNCVEACSVDAADLLQRVPRTEDDDDPAIHYGLIASANRVMKDATAREIAAQHGVLCFEMEAAGLMNHFPCLVIRGICDYSDSHKNKGWQGFAAMTAAAYARNLLERITPNRIEAEKPIAQYLCEIQENMDIVQNGVTEILRSKRTQEENDILQWLTPVEYNSQQHEIICKYHLGTGQWLLSSDKFQGWLSTTNSTLFCHGIPGAGKTVLTSLVIDHLNKEYGTEETFAPIAYIYCSHQRRGQGGAQQLEDLLACLAKQLVESHPSLPTFVKELHHKHTRESTRPLRTDLVTLLQRVIDSSTKTLILIDALDELSDKCRSELLAEIFKIQSETALGIFLTSRPSLDIEKELRGCSLYESFEIRARDCDMKSYLDSRISELKVDIADIRTEIKDTISRAADGMYVLLQLFAKRSVLSRSRFLLAQLYFDMLCDKTTITKVRVALTEIREMPVRNSSKYSEVEALNDMYDHVFARINSQSTGLRELAIQILCWVTCAVRPLTSTELQHSLAIVVGESEFDGGNIPLTSTMISVCHGLVTIDENSQIIRLVHYTTQEYLNTHRNVLQSLHISEPEAYLAECCVAYLSLSTFQEGCCATTTSFEERLRQNPFYKYAASHWGSHFGKTPEDFQRKIPILLGSDQLISSAMQVIYASWYDTPCYSRDLCHQRGARLGSALHLAAYFGLAVTSMTLIEAGFPFDDSDNLSYTPLLCASRIGNEAVVQLLVESGADIESMTAEHDTSVALAAFGGHETVVRLLLENGAATNIAYNERPSPLLMAIENGDDPMARLLIRNHAYINPASSEIGIPLVRAIEKQYNEIALQLIEDGADTNLADSRGRTPLLAALDSDYKERKSYEEYCESGEDSAFDVLARLLIAKGANVCQADKGGRTPLSLAVTNGYETVVQLLIENGASTDLSNKDAFRHLWWASEFGYEKTARLMIEEGAVLDSANQSNMTPLLLASMFGHETIVRLLIERGATVDLQGGSLQETPLLSALYGGHTEIVQLLVEKGASSTSTDIYGMTPLMMASVSGQEAIVELMLNNGVDTDFVDIHGMTSLLGALTAGRQRVVQLLINNGASIDLTDSHGRTPLHTASLCGHEAIVQILIDSGAATDVVDESGQTPLCLASHFGHESVVQLLSGKGATTGLDQEK